MVDCRRFVFVPLRSALIRELTIGLFADSNSGTTTKQERLINTSPYDVAAPTLARPEATLNDDRDMDVCSEH